MQPELVRGGGLGGRERKARRHYLRSGGRAARRDSLVENRFCFGKACACLVGIQ